MRYKKNTKLILQSNIYDNNKLGILGRSGAVSGNRVFPSWEQIHALRNPLTEGELALVKYLDTYLPQEWEIYVQPFLNGDRPDVIILNERIGITIFEVKDWNPVNYSTQNVLLSGSTTGQANTKYFVTDNRGTWPIPNPIQQVERYREKLISLYLPELGEAIDSNNKVLSAFKVALYFHNMTTPQAKCLVHTSEKRCVVFGNEKLKEKTISEVVLDVNRKSSLSMREGWAAKIRIWLKPPFHALEQGTKLELTNEQRRHVTPIPKTHQRLRGVAGSGKSLVIAQRAANLATQGKHVLIVTFNITLWHYLRDLVSRARTNFSWEHIEFTHFHRFCRDFLCENEIKWPGEDNHDNNFLNECIPQLVKETIQDGKNKNNRKYDAILIDEGQDFQQSWYEVLCEFLTANDELLFVADERQNIYGRDISWLDGMHGTKFRGRWRELKESYRLPPPILDYTNKFAQVFLPGVGVDPIPDVYQPSFFEPHLIWRDISDLDEALEKICCAVKWLIETHEIHPQDIVILVPSHKEGWHLVKLLEEKNYKVNHVFEDDSKKHPKKHHNKKAFWMGDGRLKACTIHSFKGWELRNVIILTPSVNHPIDAQCIDFILYTAFTRVRENLIVFNSHPRYVEYGKSWPKHWDTQ